MLPKFNLNFKKLRDFQRPLIGDWLVIFMSLVSIFILFQQLWVTTSASQFKVTQGNRLIGIFDLNQTRELRINGTVGESIISIENGRVRFKQSPCRNQYCVHQGWLSRAGQLAICIPNQISLQLIGAKSTYDSLNY